MGKHRDTITSKTQFERLTGLSEDELKRPAPQSPAKHSDERDDRSRGRKN